MPKKNRFNFETNTIPVLERLKGLGISYAPTADNTYYYVRGYLMALTDNEMIEREKKLEFEEEWKRYWREELKGCDLSTKQRNRLEE